MAETRRIWAYDEIHGMDARLYHPKDEREIAAIIGEARQRGVRLTVRAGGQSLGEQALGRTVLMLDRPAFQGIGPVCRDGDGDLVITCGAGARWGDVARQISERGFVPRSVVTTGDATVGGTAVVDGLSRMSPIVGKEGEQIKALRMIHGDGRGAVTYSRADGGERGAVFDAVLSSYGTLGVVTEVTFKVAQAIPGYHGRPNVHTHATRYMSGTYDWERVLGSIIEDSGRYHDEYLGRKPVSGPHPHLGPRFGFSIAAWLAGEGLALTRLEHRYVHDIPGQRMSGGLYTENSCQASLSEKVAGYSPTLAELVSTVGFPNGVYVDSLCGFLFNMGNSATPAKAQVRALGSRLNFVQQTFVVPTPPSGPQRRPDVALTWHFLLLMAARCREREIRPLTIDLLHLKADTALLSASRGLDGFAVTITFGDHNQSEWPFISEALKALSCDVMSLGGRVHLVKNVEADPSDLRQMYQESLEALHRIKASLDPQGIFTNAFYERYFAEAPGARAP